MSLLSEITYGGAGLDAVNSYRDAVPTRSSYGWSVQQPIDNGSISSRLDLAAMRDRAFAVYENNPVARSILHTELTNVVADGYRLQAKARDDKGQPATDWNKEAVERWDAWLDQADIRGIFDGSKMQRNPYRSARRDGFGGIVLVDAGGFSKLQFVPAAKIQTPDGKQGDKNFVNGVELDASLTPVRFWILDLDEYGKRVFTPVPANNFVFLVPELDDDLGVIGPTCYSTIFEILDQLFGYVDGVAVAARMATVFGLMIKSDAAPQDFKNLPMINSGVKSPAGAQQMQRAMTLQNGSLKILGSRDDVVQVNAQQPMQQTPEFIRSLLRLIGLPFDMPLELIAHDMSTVTFASARIGLLQYYRASYARQRWYKSHWSRIYRWWASREQKRQQLGLPGAFKTQFPPEYFPHALHARAWAYTDPIRDPQSDFLQMDMGVKSLQQVCAERGTDYEEVQIEQAASLALRRLKNLPTDIRSTLSRDQINIRGTEPAQVLSEDSGSQQQPEKGDRYDDGNEDD